MVFTLSQWGQLRLQIQQLPHEYLFLQEHLPLMIERRDVHLVGEFVQCLRIFGVEESNSSLLDGLQFLLEEQMADGSWDNACGTQDSSGNGQGDMSGNGHGNAVDNGHGNAVDNGYGNAVDNGHGNTVDNGHGNAVDNTHINTTVNTHINPTDNTHNNNTSSTTTQPTLNVDEAYVAYHATMVAIQALIPPLFTGYGCMSESTETIVSQWYQTEV